MKEFNTLLNLIKEVLLYPRRIAGDRILGNYDMKAMNLLIVFMSIILWFVNIVGWNNYGFEMSIIILVVGLIIVPFISLLTKRFVVNFYNNLINSGLKHNIPYEIMERVLAPYLATYLVIAVFFGIFRFYFPSFRYILSTFLWLWLNLQVYYLILYRIVFLEFIEKGMELIFKKLFTIVIGLILLDFFRYAFNS